MGTNTPRLKKFLGKVVIIDASVLIKVFLNEKESQEAKKFIDLHLKRNITLLSTPLLTFELLNILVRHLKSRSAVNSAYIQFKRLKIGLIPFEDSVVKGAIKLASEDLKISFYDAAYHALAQDMGAVFLTADAKYYERMKQNGNIELFTL